MEFGIWPGPMRPPRSTSSSPVERMPTRGRRITLTGLLPTVASIPMSAALSTRPRSSTPVTPLHVLAAGPHEVAVADPPWDEQRARLLGHVLLGNDRVRALGKRRAGEDPEGLARPQRPLRHRPRGHAAGQAETRGGPGRRGGGVGAAEGVAVHRGGRPRRHVARAVHVLREHAVEALDERHPLVAEHGHARQDAIERFLDGDHARYFTPGARRADAATWAGSGPACSGRGTSCGSARRARRSRA